MQPRIYVATFMALSLTFVPVLILPIPFCDWLAAPCVYPIYVTFCTGGLDFGVFVIKTIVVVQVALYSFGFYMLARLFAHLGEEGSRTWLLVRVISLLLIFCSSFARVIHEEFLLGQTGPYTFWEACRRFYHPN